MAELQKEFSTLNAEMKDMEAVEKKESNRLKFQEYAFKIGAFGHTIEDAEKIVEISDLDREDGHVGKSGLAWTGFEGRSQTFGYVMLKSKEEYARTKRILGILEAVNALGDEKTPPADKEKHIKTILGEAHGND
jgi:hypothetical protein